MIKFKSKVVRVNEMGNKVVIEFKQKVFESGIDGPVIDDSEVIMYDTVEQANDAIDLFFS